MGKALRTVGVVLTAAALIATGVGAAAGAGLLGAEAAAVAASGGALTLFGIGVSDIAFLGTAAAFAGGLLEGKPKIGGGYGSPTQWVADPQAGVPYPIGRTGLAGSIVLADVSGDKKKYLTYVTVLGLGPIKSVESFSANDIRVNFTADGGEGANTGQQTTTLTAAVAAGSKIIHVAAVTNFAAGQTITIDGESATIRAVYAAALEFELNSPLGSSHALSASVVGPATTNFYLNRMWWKASLGPPSAGFLTFTSTGSKDTPANHSGIPPSWTSASKLSGLAHTIWTLEYDAAKYPSGTPKPMNVVLGVLVYDPRLDSTYPGGSGACRAGDETTWVYSENPYLHALTWLIGRTSNGIQTMGVHAPIAAIDVAAFVTGANVADSNGWRVGGTIYSTDSKWETLKALLQAGAGRPAKRGAMISCIVSAPRTSLDTLTAADVVGEASIPGAPSRRTRINGIWPRYREEARGWQIVPTNALIAVSAYVTADGEQRTREVEYSLVQTADQVATLARYDIENARELGPISLPCKPRWMGYGPGDCITLDEPQYGFSAQKCLVLDRSVDPASFVTTLTLCTETDAKHGYALAQTADPPPAPMLNVFDVTTIAAPTTADWTAAGGVSSSTTGSLPQIAITGAAPDPGVANVIFGIKIGDTITKVTTLDAAATGTVIGGLAPGASYIPVVQYVSARGVASDMLELAPVTTGAVAAATAQAVHQSDGTPLVASGGMQPVAISQVLDHVTTRVAVRAGSVTPLSAAGTSSMLAVNLAADADISATISLPVGQLFYYADATYTGTGGAYPSESFPSTITLALYRRFKGPSDSAYGSWSSLGSHTWSKVTSGTPTADQYLVQVDHTREYQDTIPPSHLYTTSESCVSPASLDLVLTSAGQLAGLYEYCVVGDDPESIAASIALLDTSGKDFVPAGFVEGAPGSFAALTDVAPLSGSAGKIPQVTAGSDGLTFVDQLSLKPNLKNTPAQTVFDQTPVLFSPGGDSVFNTGARLPASVTTTHTTTARIGYVFEGVFNGSGVPSGPLTADYTVGVSAIKVGYAGATPPTPGEMDIQIWTGRADRGDLDGLQMNLQIVDRGMGDPNNSGFCCGIEIANSSIQPVTGSSPLATVQSQRTSTNIVNPREGTLYAFAAIKDGGAGGSGFYLDSTNSGSSYTNSIDINYQGFPQLVGRMADNAILIYPFASSSNPFALRNDAGQFKIFGPTGATNLLLDGGNVITDGQLDAAFVRLTRQYTASTKPAASAAGAGAFISVYDAGGSLRFYYSDGAYWNDFGAGTRV
jgi:hypothetical protein